MLQLEPVTFESPASKRVYKHVEQNGPHDAADVQRAVGLADDEFETAVDSLTAAGYLERRGDALALALDLGGSETFETKDFTYAVRPATDEDFDALVDTVEEIAAKKTYVVAEELAAEMRYDETVFRHNTVRARLFFVATADDDIIGWCHLDLPLTEKLRPTAQLTVGVRDAYRGYGVGSALLDRALDWAAGHDYLKVYNNVARTNMQAVSFLERRGWEREGVREDHYTIGHKEVDQVMMAYTL